MSHIQFFDCNLSDLQIDMRELGILMGYGNHSPGKEILDIVDEMLGELRVCCNPRYGYILEEGDIIDRENLRVGNIILNPGKIITSAMRNADYYAIFTATVNTGFDEWLKKLKERDDMLWNFVADALGSIIAEAVVERLVNQLENDVACDGMLISNNYSPGYCDWKLIEQKKLFSLFPDNITGIKLTDSCLMLPIKSVSGIIAVGKNVKKKAYGCDICNMKNCVKNKKKKLFD